MKGGRVIVRHLKLTIVMSRSSPQHHNEHRITLCVIAVIECIHLIAAVLIVSLRKILTLINSKEVHMRWATVHRGYNRTVLTYFSKRYSRVQLGLVEK
ncbi:hypothetical protein AB6A40_006325 [Gnathostoma spinigerum]|uniref:Uncharacterized protein n=1 Tax=Gnathostoma spinigerum TaxID=75299 RepID=A0ABD6EQB1_9BILA